MMVVTHDFNTSIDGRELPILPLDILLSSSTSMCQPTNVSLCFLKDSVGKCLVKRSNAFSIPDVTLPVNLRSIDGREGIASLPSRLLTLISADSSIQKLLGLCLDLLWL